MKPQDTTACAKGRWEGIGGVVPDKDPWANCRQYQPTQTKTIKKSINKSIKKTMNWIEEKQEKPPFGTYVIAYCRIYGYFLGCYERILDTNAGNWRRGLEQGILPPLYWQPLPEPPKP